jgi:hypothetical protein
MWLPALGAALFLGAGLWWAITPAAAQPAPDAAASASAAAEGAAAAPAHAGPPQAQAAANVPALNLPPGHAGVAPGGPLPAGHMEPFPAGSGDRLQQRIQGMRDQLRAHPPPGAPPAGAH